MSTPLAPQILSSSLEDLVTLFDVRPSGNVLADDARDALVASSPTFGTVFTDHMARVTWTADTGWHDRRVEPYGPLQLDPATAVLHYAQEIFEGLKAYRHADGSIWTFRPEANAARFARSAHRLALPALSIDDFIASITALVRTDAAWVPTSAESSLYLRPFMYASERFLGVRPSLEAEYLVIASPVGAYFSGGVKPVSIWVDREYSRAGAGGTGAAKCGGNYASSLLPQVVAQQNGCEQVCFLDSGTRTYLEELGGMNVFVVRADGTLQTPELSGSILEGVTRSSILQLAADRGYETFEAQIPFADLLEGIRDGSVTEVFACGTAAVITPIGRLAGSDFDQTIADGTAGELTTALRSELTDIQTGRAADRHGWMRRLA
ncbi:branched-chain amino acid aminotransferase [Cellulosimicrobium arenosum]|uniref:Branched-chain-amino-acid aminotransferase n=1 Tax=Cellulosimicrobium arenosum TaxID=2708133 RepID=A0A927J210_9MICO|nr:branched-chain amino acid aminotransferase [Cellulosimicrobium arenosum]MBD8080438.1 branched-chain amino acid aminotransferase [Cellulosimicrobium arenosum]